MDPTIDGLLAERDLKPRLAADPRFNAAESRRRRAQILDWVHRSDLDDPSEFLVAGTLLLTDGAQFPRDHRATYDYGAYVDRVIGSGVVGLGFATQFLHETVPGGLVAACAERGLPLVEVPDRLPFIAISRRISDEIAASRTRALEWSRDAQRAISIAALKPDGISSILLELESRLPCKVGLYDAGGRRVPAPATRGIDDLLTAAVEREIREMLRRGRRAASRLDSEGGLVTVQTLGQAGSLRGALAVHHVGPLDRAGSELVTSVIALASLALERNRALDEARLELRAGLLELLVGGDSSGVRRAAESVWGGFPSGALVVAAIAPSGEATELRNELEVLGQRSEGAVFYAPRAGRICVLVELNYVDSLVSLVARHEGAMGLSATTSLSQTRVALEEAEQALARAERLGLGLVRFDDVVAHGVMGLLREEHAERLARRMLTPLIARDTSGGTSLVDSLTVWLDEGCSWERASRRLGIHRHTLRSRIHVAGEVLHLDLESLEGRLEAWAALQFQPAAPINSTEN